MSDPDYANAPSTPAYTGAPGEPLPGHFRWIRWRGGPWMPCWMHDGVVSRPGTEQQIADDHPRLEKGPVATPPGDTDPVVQVFVNLHALSLALPASAKFGDHRDRFLEEIKAGLKALGWAMLEAPP